MGGFGSKARSRPGRDRRHRRLRRPATPSAEFEGNGNRDSASDRRAARVHGGLKPPLFDGLDGLLLQSTTGSLHDANALRLAASRYDNLQDNCSLNLGRTRFITVRGVWAVDAIGLCNACDAGANDSSRGRSGGPGEVCGRRTVRRGGSLSQLLLHDFLDELIFAWDGEEFGVRLLPEELGDANRLHTITRVGAFR